VNNYKWHLALITFVLISIASIFIFFDENKSFLTKQTNLQIDELLRLSINAPPVLKVTENSLDTQAAEKIRKRKITTLITALEARAEAASKVANSHLDTRNTLFLFLILFIFIYLSYVLLKVLNTSKQIEASNARIKSEIKKIQTTFSSIGDAVITTERSGLIDYMNTSAQELTNYTLKKTVKYLSISFLKYLMRITFY